MNLGETDQKPIMFYINDTAGVAFQWYFHI